MIFSGNKVTEGLPKKTAVTMGLVEASPGVLLLLACFVNQGMISCVFFEIYYSQNEYTNSSVITRIDSVDCKTKVSVTRFMCALILFFFQLPSRPKVVWLFIRQLAIN